MGSCNAKEKDNDDSKIPINIYIHITHEDISKIKKRDLDMYIEKKISEQITIKKLIDYLNICQ